MNRPAAAERVLDARPDADSGGFGIYVHWPYCLSKCPYCDFNSHVADAIPETRWRAAILSELAHFAQATPGRTVSSIFFGGGTPSLMSPETAAAVIAEIARHWTLAADAEVTLEANPTSVETAKMHAFRRAGVNRASLGVQALDDEALRFLGRHHTAREALAAIDAAATAFDRFSFDLIYARPGQTAAMWRDELADALRSAGDHLSLYQLTIEPGTRFFRDGVVGADDENGVTLFEETQEIMAAAGLPAYEISNHARASAECRHNLVYWRGGDYIGVGPGAHGRLTSGGIAEAVYQIHDPGRWLTAVTRAGHGIAKRTGLSASERADELLLSGLRLTEGIDAERFHARAGMRLEDAVDPVRLAELIEAGFLSLDQSVLRATSAGRIRLNAVLAALLA